MDAHVDPTLLSEVRRYGHFDVNGCFTCGSCTAVCDLSDDAASFPRTSMRMVQLGLRQALIRNLDPWLCHYCGSCSTSCPRKAEPGESMMTLRRFLIAQYDWTGIASKIATSKAWHIGALSLVASLVFGLLIWFHLYYVEMPLGDFTSTSMGMEHMFPLMDYFTLVVIVFPFAVLLSNALRMSWVIKPPLSLLFTELKTFPIHFFTHKGILDCKTEKDRWPAHFLVGTGCTFMLLILVFFLRWFQTDQIYPISHPQRWVGYLLTAFMIYGSGAILVGRAKKRREIHKHSDFGDWTFPILLLATAVSGMLVHIFRYAGFPLATHYTYAIHLIIAVPMLLVEMPFGKWSHMIFRPLALYFLALKKRAAVQVLSSASTEVSQHALS